MFRKLTGLVHYRALSTPPAWTQHLLTPASKELVKGFDAYLQSEDKPVFWAYTQSLAENTDDYHHLRYLRNNLHALNNYRLEHLRLNGKHCKHPDITAFASIDGVHRLMWSVQRKIEARHEVAVRDHIKTLKNSPRSSLLTIIKLLRDDLKTKSIYNVEQIAKLHATEMLLHPEFAAVAIFDRGVYAAKALLVAKKLGYRTILLCLKEEETSLAATLADHVLRVNDLGNAYECAEALKKFNAVIGVKGYRIGVDPGFGKLSENPALVAACQKNQFIFIGPDAPSMSVMGNKKLAKKLASVSGVPVIPGYDGEKQDLDSLMHEALKIGFPLMVKKARSGGGYGNRCVMNMAQFKQAVEGFRGQDQNEPIFFEKYLENPLHIEVQVAIANGEVVLLGSRNCSLQRDCQKTIEEAPADIPALTNIMQYAKHIAKAMMQMGYTHLGTIEFLVKDDLIYFLEVNPRIQVEHGVTEIIHSGLNLIALKFWIASGKSMTDFLKEALLARDIDVTHPSAERMVHLLRQHSPVKFAIEARVEAMRFQRSVDGSMQKIPVKGTVTDVRLPASDISCGIQVGTEIDTMTVNPLLALPIGKGATRLEALQDLYNILIKMKIDGVATNLERLRVNVKYLIEHPELEINTGTTNILDAEFVGYESMAPERHATALNLSSLFHKRNVFVTAESRIPEVNYTPAMRWGGHWEG